MDFGIGSDKYSSCVPFNGDIAKVIPDYQQLQKMEAALDHVVREYITELVPVIESCIESMVSFFGEILQAYSNADCIRAMVEELSRDENRDRMEKLGYFLFALSEAQEAGEKEFTCPLCGGTVRWGRADGNGHVHAGCDRCGMMLAE